MCKELKIKLVVAGQGDITKIVPEGSLNSLSDNLGVSYIGYIDPKERLILMSGAVCLISPSTYAEPFGGVAVEAQLCGTPVISTDWGAFPETVKHGVTGFRCRTMDHFVWSLSVIETLDRQYIRERAIRKWSLERVVLMYEEYFSMLHTLGKKGFYEPNSSRSQLDWLNA
jgi:glycosyltransferase involved in cell wall biosynthesis